MSIFDMIKSHLGSAVPYANHTGVVVDDIGDGVAKATLDQRQETSNHLGSQHAGALFTLGEAASGAAMAGGFAERMLELQPIAANAEIAFKKIAKGQITASARVDGDVAALRETLRSAGKVQFPVLVSLADQSGVEVATMRVDWNVRERRPDA